MLNDSAQISQVFNVANENNFVRLVTGEKLFLVKSSLLGDSEEKEFIVFAEIAENCSMEDVRATITNIAELYSAEEFSGKDDFARILMQTITI